MECLTIKLMMLGDADVGKTCLLRRFMDNRFTGHYKCTVGIDSKTRMIEISGSKVKLEIWDTAGEERFRAIMASYYRHVDGIILVFDTTNRRSYAHVDYWLEEVQKHASRKVRILLVGSKCDAHKKRQVCHQGAAMYAESLGLPFMEASAMTGHNVERLFSKLAVSVYDMHLEKRKGKKSPDNMDAVTLQPDSAPRSFCC